MPLLVENGIISRMVPTVMTVRNPRQMVRETVMVKSNVSNKKAKAVVF